MDVILGSSALSHMLVLSGRQGSLPYIYFYVVMETFDTEHDQMFFYMLYFTHRNTVYLLS